MGPFGDVSIAGSVVGVVGPILTAVVLIFVNKLANKVGGVQESTDENHKRIETVEQELKLKLAEAEGAIRGDIKNGVKDRLDSLGANPSKT